MMPRGRWATLAIVLVVGVLGLSSIVPTGAGRASPNSGSQVSMAVAHHVKTFAINFRERGLSSGTNWSVVVGNVMIYSNTTLNKIKEPNGTYAWSIPSERNVYVVDSAAYGNVTIEGSSATIRVTFQMECVSVPGGFCPRG
jgi:hypothetical protein